MTTQAQIHAATARFALGVCALVAVACSEGYIDNQDVGERFAEACGNADQDLHDMGELVGDFIEPGSAWHVSAEGWGDSSWFSAGVKETVFGPNEMSLSLHIDQEDGEYDAEVYCGEACHVEHCHVASCGGACTHLTFGWADTLLADDSRTVYINVWRVGDSPCGTFRLSMAGAYGGPPADWDCW